MVPTGRLWGLFCALALPAVAAGFVPGLWPIILALDAAGLALAAADALAARSAKVEAWRLLPPRLSVGVANRVEIHFVNRTRRQFWVRIKDELPDDFTPEPADLRVKLPASSRTRAAYLATPLQRGRFGWGDLIVRVQGPLGLVWHERRLAAATEVSVYPDLRGASRLLLSGAAIDLVNLGLRQLRRDGRGSEFARLRDYAQGDSQREVDWKATARRSRPVTRVFESERSQSVLLCVDAGRSMAAKVDGLTKLDHAVNAALFLAFVAVRNGDRVGLVVFSDGVKAYLPPAAGRSQYRRIVDTLYAARPQLTYVDYLALFKALSARLRRRSLVCVFTDLGDEEQGASLMDPVRRLALRHVPLCLTMRDTGLARLLRTSPVDAEDAFRQASASELLSEKDALKHKVSQQGIALVEVDPAELSLAAVNRYLAMKSHGRL